MVSALASSSSINLEKPSAEQSNLDFEAPALAVRSSDKNSARVRLRHGTPKKRSTLAALSFSNDTLPSVRSIASSVMTKFSNDSEYLRRWFSRYHERPHGPGVSNEIQQGRHPAKKSAHESPGGVRNPTEVFFSQHLETDFAKWRRVFLQRGKIALFLFLFTEPIFQCAPE